MICIKCNCPDHDEHDEYCWNCGHPLNSNYCSNPNCDLNNEESVPCRETTSYCPSCGSETTYKVKGLVSPIEFFKKAPR